MIAEMAKLPATKLKSGLSMKKTLSMRKTVDPRELEMQELCD